MSFDLPPIDLPSPIPASLQTTPQSFIDPQKWYAKDIIVQGKALLPLREASTMENPPLYYSTHINAYRNARYNASLCANSFLGDLELLGVKCGNPCPNNLEALSNMPLPPLNVNHFEWSIDTYGVISQAGLPRYQLVLMTPFYPGNLNSSCMGGVDSLPTDANYFYEYREKYILTFADGINFSISSE